MAVKYTKWSKNIQNGPKIYNIDIKYINIFQFKALQNIPELVFLV
jgi:hypothetical protein